jgi:hypothetical protein
MVWRPDREPEIAKVVDMRQLHLLDHRPYSANCKQQYGGGRQHVKLLWWFVYRDQVYHPWRRLFNCPRGKHQEIQWLHGDKAGVECNDCSWTRSMSEHEIETFWRESPRIGPDTKVIPPDWA